jgi:hypothetical protein
LVLPESFVALQPLWDQRPSSMQVWLRFSVFFESGFSNGVLEDNGFVGAGFLADSFLAGSSDCLCNRLHRSCFL